MRAVQAFFSASGRSPQLRLASILFLAYAIWRLCGLAWDASSVPLLALTGLGLGAALAKAAAEGVRRLHDMGSGAAVGGIVALVLAIADGGARVEGLARGDGVLVTLLNVAALAALAVLVLWPGEKGANRWGEPAASPWVSSPPAPGSGRDRSGWLLPLLSVGVVEAVIAALALFAWGVEQSNERGADFARRSQVEHERGAATASPVGKRP